LTAISAIRSGEITQASLQDLQLLSSIASMARRRKMLAPKQNLAIDNLINPIAAALGAGGCVTLDEEEIDLGEAWLVRFQEQLGQATEKELLALIDDLVLCAGLRESAS
jgi:hypothetical protein